ncbi:MAG: hypothetical protein ABIZ30_01760 [Candidatus Limnocylindrales bacterium]
MAMIRVEPVRVQVRADWFDGRPREITWNSQRVPVTGVVGVRDETAAFPVLIGPRTIFEVDTPLARLTLSYRHRTRRWSIEGLDEGVRAA